MRINKEAIPIKFSVPGAVARQAPEFGDATAYSTIGGEYFSLGAGTDITPLLHGLTDDLCQAPHWGYVISGGLVVRYTDGSEDTCTGGDVFYWPPGHTVRVDDDAEVILFSPRDEHTLVLDHMIDQMAKA
ncbi:MAG: cupin domain-containing protein [Acidimicrobiales bacterium]